MGKIKIHKSKIYNDDLDLDRFEDGDVLCCEAFNDNITFIYREQNDYEKVGVHCYLYSSKFLFNNGCDYNKDLDQYYPNHKGFLNCDHIKNLRYASSYDIAILEMNITNVININKKFEDAMNYYLMLINHYKNRSICK